eukprot:TRINITY_DN8161_c0_g1_i1.p1 TRINITY_DN8161_c0_g1~~TRINITY_DN8161_c0_g1_i1.p1  ORF type:complete len:122 (-),score=14.84 TRINITY_DN8161_c0_g1_i1:99-464(-)
MKKKKKGRRCRPSEFKQQRIALCFCFCFFCLFVFFPVASKEEGFRLGKNMWGGKGVKNLLLQRCLNKKQRDHRNLARGAKSVPETQILFFGCRPLQTTPSEDCLKSYSIRKKLAAAQRADN